MKYIDSKGIILCWLLGRMTFLRMKTVLWWVRSSWREMKCSWRRTSWRTSMRPTIRMLLLGIEVFLKQKAIRSLREGSKARNGPKIKTTWLS